MSAFILHDRYFDPEAGRIPPYFCQLFVLIGHDSLQFCILDTEKNMFIALADYRMSAATKNPGIFYAELDQFLSSEEESLKKKYPSVIIGIDSSLHTLVPASLFDLNQERKYLEFNFRLPDSCQVRSDRIEEIDTCNVYGFLPGMKEIIEKYFRETALFHRSSALLRAVYHLHTANPDPAVVYLNAREKYTDLIIFKDGRLVFFNAFPCQGKEDMLYFTLYTIGQLKLRPESVQLNISGLIDEGSESYHLLKQYTGKISMTARLSSFNYSALISQAPSHRYLELFGLALCGL